MGEWKEAGAKVHLEIRYCLLCGYVPMAAWMATGFWDELKGAFAITLTPVKDACCCPRCREQLGWQGR